MINIAVLGYGTVGLGSRGARHKQRVYQPESRRRNWVKYVLDLRDFPGDPAQNILVHNFEEIIRDERC